MEKVDIEKVAKEIYEKFKPISIFLYGSRARTDFKEDSDYEVGFIQNKKGEISRIALKEFVNNKKILIFPFVKNELVNYSLNTPFQKDIYMYELIKAGKTLAGEKFIENLKPSKITTVSLIERLGFDLGQALAAVFASREKR
jgi:predicted nucleotidyltransferase